MSTWIFICKTNTDFNFAWNYIWQRGWPGLAIFSSKYRNSSPVMELYKRLLQSDILCFQNSVFPTWCLTVTLGLTRRTPILWFQLTDWPRQAKRQRYQYSLITWGAQLGCFFAVWPHFCTTGCFVTFFLPLRLLWSEGTANVIVDQTWRSLLVQCWSLIL